MAGPAASRPRQGLPRCVPHNGGPCLDDALAVTVVTEGQWSRHLSRPARCRSRIRPREPGSQGARAARRQGQQGSGQGSDQGSGQAAKACSDMALT
jgi:hypothetical protein